MQFITACTTLSYPEGLNKEKNRVVRKRALKIETKNGEAYMYRKGKRVRVVHNVNDQKLILDSYHSDPTCGHYGVTSAMGGSRN